MSARGDTMPSFKVVVAGDGGVGKSALVNYLADGGFVRDYVPTIGATVMPLEVSTTRGSVHLSLWDTAGQERYAGLSDGYYILANAALVCYANNDQASFHAVPKWVAGIRNVCDDIPLILLRLKAESASLWRDGNGGRCAHTASLAAHTQEAIDALGVPEFKVSGMSRPDIAAVLVNLLRELTGDDELELVKKFHPRLSSRFELRCPWVKAIGPEGDRR
jgi:small GTP-binding protein